MHIRAAHSLLLEATAAVDFYPGGQGKKRSPGGLVSRAHAHPYLRAQRVLGRQLQVRALTRLEVHPLRQAILRRLHTIPRSELAARSALAADGHPHLQHRALAALGVVNAQ